MRIILSTPTAFARQVERARLISYSTILGNQSLFHNKWRWLMSDHIVDVGSAQSLLRSRRIFFIYFFTSCLTSIYNDSVMTDPPDCQPSLNAVIFPSTAWSVTLYPMLSRSFYPYFPSLLYLAARAFLLRIRPSGISTFLILDYMQGLQAS